MVHLFGTSHMAEGYAKSRPPVHQEILRRVKQHVPPRCAVALDVGCGAGLSTQALHGIAEEIIGLEPVEAMVQWAFRVAPQAGFVVGAAEALPFAANSLD